MEMLNVDQLCDVVQSLVLAAGEDVPDLIPDEVYNPRLISCASPNVPPKDSSADLFGSTPPLSTVRFNGFHTQAQTDTDNDSAIDGGRAFPFASSQLSDNYGPYEPLQLGKQCWSSSPDANESSWGVVFNDKAIYIHSLEVSFPTANTSSSDPSALPALHAPSCVQVHVLPVLITPPARSGGRQDTGQPQEGGMTGQARKVQTEEDWALHPARFRAGADGTSLRILVEASCRGVRLTLTGYTPALPPLGDGTATNPRALRRNTSDSGLPVLVGTLLDGLLGPVRKLPPDELARRTAASKSGNVGKGAKQDAEKRLGAHAIQRVTFYTQDPRSSTFVHPAVLRAQRLHALLSRASNASGEHRSQQIVEALEAIVTQAVRSESSSALFAAAHCMLGLHVRGMRQSEESVRVPAAAAVRMAQAVQDACLAALTPSPPAGGYPLDDYASAGMNHTVTPVFDPQGKHSFVTLLPGGTSTSGTASGAGQDNRRAKSSSSSTPQSAVGLYGFQEGVVSWSMKLIRDSASDEHSCFGFATRPVKDHHYSSSGDLFVLRAYSGGVHGKGATKTDGTCNERKIHPGDVVKFEAVWPGNASVCEPSSKMAEYPTGCVSAWINGRALGVMWTGIEGKTIFPAMCTYGADVEVEFMSVEAEGAARASSAKGNETPGPAVGHGWTAASIHPLTAIATAVGLIPPPARAAAAAASPSVGDTERLMHDVLAHSRVLHLPVQALARLHATQADGSLPKSLKEQQLKSKSEQIQPGQLQSVPVFSHYIPLEACLAGGYAHARGQVIMGGLVDTEAPLLVHTQGVGALQREALMKAGNSIPVTVDGALCSLAISMRPAPRPFALTHSPSRGRSTLFEDLSPCASYARLPLTLTVPPTVLVALKTQQGIALSARDVAFLSSSVQLIEPKPSPAAWAGATSAAANPFGGAAQQGAFDTLAAPYSLFTATVAVDDSSEDVHALGWDREDGLAVQMQVWATLVTGEDTCLWKSRPLSSPGQSQACYVSIRGCKSLWLVSDWYRPASSDGAPSTHGPSPTLSGAHVPRTVWLNPVVHVDVPKGARGYRSQGSISPAQSLLQSALQAICAPVQLPFEPVMVVPCAHGAAHATIGGQQNGLLASCPVASVPAKQVVGDVSGSTTESHASLVGPAQHRSDGRSVLDESSASSLNAWRYRLPSSFLDSPALAAWDGASKGAGEEPASVPLLSLARFILLRAVEIAFLQDSEQKQALPVFAMLMSTLGNVYSDGKLGASAGLTDAFFSDIQDDRDSTGGGKAAAMHVLTMLRQSLLPDIVLTQAEASVVQSITVGNKSGQHASMGAGNDGSPATRQEQSNTSSWVLSFMQQVYVRTGGASDGADGMPTDVDSSTASVVPLSSQSKASALMKAAQQSVGFGRGTMKGPWKDSPDIGHRVSQLLSLSTDVDMVSGSSLSTLCAMLLLCLEQAQMEYQRVDAAHVPHIPPFGVQDADAAAAALTSSWGSTVASGNDSTLLASGSLGVLRHDGLAKAAGYTWTGQETVLSRLVKEELDAGKRPRATGLSSGPSAGAASSALGMQASSVPAPVGSGQKALRARRTGTAVKPRSRPTDAGAASSTMVPSSGTVSPAFSLGTASPPLPVFSFGTPVAPVATAEQAQGRSAGTSPTPFVLPFVFGAPAAAPAAATLSAPLTFGLFSSNAGQPMPAPDAMPAAKAEAPIPRPFVFGQAASAATASPPPFVFGTPASSAAAAGPGQPQSAAPPLFPRFLPLPPTGGLLGSSPGAPAGNDMGTAVAFNPDMLHTAEKPGSVAFALPGSAPAADDNGDSPPAKRAQMEPIAEADHDAEAEDSSSSARAPTTAPGPVNAPTRLQQLVHSYPALRPTSTPVVDERSGGLCFVPSCAVADGQGLLDVEALRSAAYPWTACAQYCLLLLRSSLQSLKRSGISLLDPRQQSPLSINLPGTMDASATHDESFDATDVHVHDFMSHVLSACRKAGLPPHVCAPWLALSPSEGQGGQENMDRRAHSSSDGDSELPLPLADVKAVLELMCHHTPPAVPDASVPPVPGERGVADTGRPAVKRTKVSDEWSLLESEEQEGRQETASTQMQSDAKDTEGTIPPVLQVAASRLYESALPLLFPTANAMRRLIRGWVQDGATLELCVPWSAGSALPGLRGEVSTATRGHTSHKRAGIATEQSNAGANSTKVHSVQGMPVQQVRLHRLLVLIQAAAGKRGWPCVLRSVGPTDNARPTSVRLLLALPAVPGTSRRDQLPSASPTLTPLLRAFASSPAASAHATRPPSPSPLSLLGQNEAPLGTSAHGQAEMQRSSSTSQYTAHTATAVHFLDSVMSTCFRRAGLGVWSLPGGCTAGETPIPLRVERSKAAGAGVEDANKLKNGGSGQSLEARALPSAPVARLFLPSVGSFQDLLQS